MTAEAREPDPGGRPWWASEDPAGHRGGAGSTHGEHTRPAWLDAVEALDGAVRAAARGARSATAPDPGPAGAGEDAPHARVPGDGPDPAVGEAGTDGVGDEGHHHGTGDAWCHVCPVCALLRALEGSRPDVLTHLSEAARHLSLAARSVLDAQAQRAGDASGDGFEPIDLDG